MLYIIPVQYGKNSFSQKISSKVHDKSTWHRQKFMCKFWKKNLKQINTDIIGYVTFLKE